MKLTVLGKYGPYPAPGGACSGYLIEEGDTKILIDCGNGVLSRLQQVMPATQLSAVVLSHLHSDHMSDLMVLRYALGIWKMRNMIGENPLQVWAPAQPEDEYQRLFYQDLLDIRTIKDGMAITIGALDFTFKEMTHPVQSFAMAITDGTKRIVYTGDTNMNKGIVPFAQGADLFIADTGLLSRDKTGPNVPHLTAQEVGQIGAEASVKRLMITHLWPGYDEEEVRREVALHYPEAFVAQEMQSYDIV